MPFGPSLFGLAYFAGIKLAGYSAAGAYLNRQAPAEAPRPAALRFGITRTLVGIGVGTGFGLAFSTAASSPAEGGFYAALIPLRLLEWLLVLWVFYRGVPSIYGRRWELSTRGIVWSYLLDLPALAAAFVLPGGVWIC